METAIKTKDPLLELIDEIIEKRTAVLRRKITPYPRNQFIASDIGDCNRAMVYSVSNWKDRALHNEYLQAMFDVGKDHEGRIIRDLLEIGIEVEGTQSSFEIKNRKGEVICRLKIDGQIRYKGERYPMELKTMNINSFNAINSIEDFQKRPLFRKYLRQIQLYLYVNGKEKGLFILTDLQGHYRFIPVYLDYGECELILQRLEKGWEHVKAKTLPDRIEYNQAVCDRCPFATICLPDVINKAPEDIQNDELAEQIERHENIKPLAQEYDKIHDRIKGIFKGVEKATVNNRFLITGLPSSRTVYELPEEVEKQIDDLKKEYAKKVPMTRLKIIDLENKTTEIDE